MKTHTVGQSLQSWRAIPEITKIPRSSEKDGLETYSPRSQGPISETSYSPTYDTTTPFERDGELA